MGTAERTAVETQWGSGLPRIGTTRENATMQDDRQLPSVTGCWFTVAVNTARHHLASLPEGE